jgi:hypothetical protein
MDASSQNYALNFSYNKDTKLSTTPEVKKTYIFPVETSLGKPVNKNGLKDSTPFRL